jgi:hypothetical protein
MHVFCLVSKRNFLHLEWATCKLQLWFPRITHPWLREARCLDPWSCRNSVMGTVNLRFVKTSHAIVMWSVSHPVCHPVDFCVPRGDVGINWLISFPHDATTLVVQDLRIIEAIQSHSETQHTLWIPWTSDQPDAETSTWQHTTLTEDKHPCPRRDSNPQSQQANNLSLAP